MARREAEEAAARREAGAAGAAEEVAQRQAAERARREVGLAKGDTSGVHVLGNQVARRKRSPSKIQLIDQLDVLALESPEAVADEELLRCKPAALRQAIKAAQAAGVEGELLGAATSTLAAAEEAQERAAARKREEERGHAAARLATATAPSEHGGRVELGALRTALREAEAAGVGVEQVAAASVLLAEAEAEAVERAAKARARRDAARALNSALPSLMHKASSGELRHACEAARAAGVEAAEVEAAEAKLREVVAREVAEAQAEVAEARRREDEEAETKAQLVHQLASEVMDAVVERAVEAAATKMAQQAAESPGRPTPERDHQQGCLVDSELGDAEEHLVASRPPQRRHPRPQRLGGEDEGGDAADEADEEEVEEVVEEVEEEVEEVEESEEAEEVEEVESNLVVVSGGAGDNSVEMAGMNAVFQGGRPGGGGATGT